MKIPYGKQQITEDDIKEVVETLRSELLTQGPKIDEFESKFAKYIGAKYAVAVANGTAALHLCALALGVNESTKVITTPITFVASANCIRYCGGTVEFVDIDPSTAVMDINKVETLLKTKPKGYYSGIIPVDFGGYPMDLERLNKLCQEYNLWTIEDACHAPGGFFNNSNNEEVNCGNGKYSDLAIFSFHPVKHIATGEGGMITTSNERLYKKLLLLRTHGITRDQELLHENHGGWYYEMQALGYNYRISDIQAALGISQLKRADTGILRRRTIAKKYDLAFANTSIKPLASHSGHAYHLYVIQTEARLDLYNYLRSHNIFSQVHYIPVHLQPYYKAFGFKKGDFPISERYYDNCLSLPMYPSLSEDEQQFVIDSVLAWEDDQNGK